MQVKVVSGSQNVFNNLVNYTNTDSVRDILSDGMGAVRDKLGSIKNSFVDKAYRMYENIYGHKEEANIKRALVEVGGVVNGDYIVHLGADDLKNANDTMRPLIMSSLEINRLYKNNSISGYDGCFFEPESHLPIEHQETYELVTSGEQKVDEDGDNYYTSYQGDMEITLDERMFILSMQDTVLRLLSEDIDKTGH